MLGLAAASVLAAAFRPCLAQPANVGKPLPSSVLSVWRGGEWIEWWRSETAPARWTTPSPTLATTAAWGTARPGLDTASLRISGPGEAWRLRIVLVRLDPARFQLELNAKVGPSGRADPWSVDDAPETAVIATNSGMFDATGPWGWVMHGGRTIRPPAHGPHTMSVTIDSAGGVHLSPPESLEVVRATPAREAFQAYPMLLVGNGDVERSLLAAGRGLDVAHRDARLGLGLLRDGRVLFALTRFEALGGALSALPFGLTVPESAALFGALGCRRAVLLDGGISAQLMVRPERGAAIAWHGLRKVALGIIAVPRVAPNPVATPVTR